MKEQYKPIEKLTKESQASYARKRNIFMEPRQGEQGQRPTGPAQGNPGTPEAQISPALVSALENLRERAPSQPASERDRELTAGRWADYYRGQGRDIQSLSELERLGLQRVIEAGSPPPVAGGQEPEISIPENIPTNSPIRARLKTLNDWLKAYGDYDIDALRKTYDDISSLDVPDAYKVDAMTSINSAIQGLRQKQEAQRQAQEARMEERERQSESVGWYKERLVTPEELNLMERAFDNAIATSAESDPLDQLLDRLAPVDKLFNRMFDRADANPHADFEHAMGVAGSQEFMHFTTALNQLRERAGTDHRKSELIKRLIEKYSSEHKLRELLHNAYFIAETGGEAKDFAGYTKQFQSEFADLAFKSSEVEVAFRMREQVLYQIKRENGGTIPYEKVAYIAEKGWSEWERRTEKMISEANEKKMFSDPPLERWKIDRALSISRGMGMVLLRFPEIVAECPLRAPVQSIEAQPSIPWETIAWELNPLDHKIKRYEIHRELGAALLYSSSKRKKPWWRLWNQDEIARAVEFNAIAGTASAEGEDRMADMRNMTKIGGWATHSSWRSLTSALEEDQGQLRRLLNKNPGMAMKLVWNAYQIGGKAEGKKQWIAQWKRENPGASDDQFMAAWKIKEKELDAEGPGKKAEEADIATWKGAASRIPAVILRVITDPANRLLSHAQKTELIREIFGATEGEAFQKAYTETETDLTFAKESLMRRRRERAESFERREADGNIANEQDIDALIDQDFSIIGDETRIARAKKLRDVLVRIMNTDESLQKKIIDKVKSRGFPFAITNEDVPFGEYRFAQTGGRGLITRRNNDWFQEVQANNGMVEMMKTINRYKSPEQIIETLEKIFDQSEVHDRDRAEDFIGFLAKGIIRLYEKDGVYKFPFFGEVLGIGNLIQHRGKRGMSYAQTLYGNTAMAWDSDDIYNFTEHLRQKILTGKRGRGIIEDIRKETGGTLPQAFMTRSKFAAYLFGLFFIYGMGEKIVKEKW